MKIVFHPSFFGDIFHRRVGWQRNLRPLFFNHPGGYEVWVWCFHVFVPHLTPRAADASPESPLKNKRQVAKRR